jgi:type I restriction enzyme M protein
MSTDTHDDANLDDTADPGVPDPDLIKKGSVEDYVSGLPVKSTPEEIEAVQVYARRLVEDYGYPKAHLQTRPQWRVRHTPSASGKSYPIDIAVFSGTTHRDDDLFMVVECKRAARKDGLQQLKLYLDMCQAELGVWFNGFDHQYIRKVLHADGSRSFEELPNIPRHGQRIEDIGLYRRKDLVAASNLRAVFGDIRNHLAGNASGITRDEALAQQVIHLLFCKIYDEVNRAPKDIVEFRWGHLEEPAAVEARVQNLFSAVKDEYPDVFDEGDRLTLDAKSLAYVVGELQTYSLIEADRDAIGDAFEVFIGPALRGAEGQFFTPRNVVRAVVEMVNPQPGEMIIDPACGSGGFLTVALEHVWRELEAEGRAKQWSPAILERRKRDVATRTFRGLDKDAFLAKCTKAYMAILGDGRGGVFRVDSSLQPPGEWPEQVQQKVQLGKFDVVLTNPPFGKKIRVTGPNVLGQFDMGHKWTTDRLTGKRTVSEDLQKDQPPQLLFVERCLQLLKPGGRLGIVLPESLFGSSSYSHIVEWLQGKARVLAVAAMPEPLFKTSGKVGTHTKVCIVVLQRLPVPDDGQPIFMADAKWCGHDSRGNETLKTEADGTKVLLDDVPKVAASYTRWRSTGDLAEDHLGFRLPRAAVKGTILIPKYYDPELQEQLRRLEATHDLPALLEFMDADALDIQTGVEVGKMAYGTGPIPFIRTSDLSNWELKADPKHGVSVELYDELKAQHPQKFDVRAGDIFVVKDGTYLVGTSAVVSDLDTKILYQSHLFKVRVRDHSAIDPWLLFAALNSPIAKRQIRAKRFTQDIIDTLGNRLAEVRVPIPRDLATRTRIAEQTERAVQTRARLREETRRLTLEVEGDLAFADLSELDEAD